LTKKNATALSPTSVVDTIVPPSLRLTNDKNNGKVRTPKKFGSPSSRRRGQKQKEI
jgi:hypothetical protein